MGDEVFEEPRQRQYQCPRELLFSTVVESMSLVSLGPRPSLHAAAKQAGHLPVIEPMAGAPSLPASEKRLAPLPEHRGAALPGHTLAVYDPDRISTQYDFGKPSTCSPM